MFTVNLSSRFITKPTRIDFWPAKQILRYLAGTSDFGIQYQSGVKLKLEGFADSDWCGYLQDRKSTSCFVFNLGTSGVC